MSNPTLSRDDVINELDSIQSQILDLVDQAKDTLKMGGFEGALMRANAYWVAHIICALSNDHGYLGGSMVTLADTIDELLAVADEEDAEDEEEAEGDQ